MNDVDSELIFEAWNKITHNKNLIVVDVQPAYEQRCFHISDFCNFLNNYPSNKKIYYFYVGSDSGFTEDDKYSIIEWLYENECKEETIDRIKFIEKDYGFFRDLMDTGIDENIIKKLIRYMVITRKYSLEDEDKETILKYFGTTNGEIERAIDDLNSGRLTLHLPGYIDDKLIRELKQNQPFIIVGGGRRECLAEIELLLSTFNISHSKNNKFIYG